jgi:hypothetical protein
MDFYRFYFGFFDYGTNEIRKSGLLRMNLRRAKGWRRLPFIMCMDKLHSKRDANLSNPNNLNGRLKLLTWSVLNCDIDSILNVGDRKCRARWVFQALLAHFHHV